MSRELLTITLLFALACCAVLIFIRSSGCADNLAWAARAIYGCCAASAASEPAGSSLMR